MTQAGVERVVRRGQPTAQRMPRDRQALARHWLTLAIGALAVSGALSLGVVLARVPSLARFLTDTDVARRFLVVHVGLGVVVWFSALPVALFHLQRLAIGSSAHVSPVGALAPWLSTAGASALLGGLVPGLGTVHPVNYVPAVAHPLYAIGLGLFFTGVVLSYLERGAPGMIRGSDLRIPGHYHACIGAVTLAYMALALLLAGGASRAPDPSPTLRRVALLYGVGQLAFSTGLVLAGSYGLGRKTYGIEQHIGHAGQRIGLWVMAAGGVLAFAGGAVWAVAMMRRLRRSERPLAMAAE